MALLVRIYNRLLQEGEIDISKLKRVIEIARKVIYKGYDSVEK